MNKTLFFIFTFLFLSCSTKDSDVPLTNLENSSGNIQYTLKVFDSKGGTVSTNGGTYTSGSSVTIVAQPKEGYRFDNWSNGSTESSLKLTITSDISITALFVWDSDGVPFTRNTHTISNPNPRPVDLITTFQGNPSIFVYQKDGFKYLITPGVSDAGQTVRESSPKGKTLVFYMDENGWSEYSVEEDTASSWVIRNFDTNSDFFILGDGNEIGNGPWFGDIIKGTPNNGEILWERVNNDSQMGFYHDVAIGKLNEDNYLDIIGVGFNVFLGKENGQFDFIGHDSNFKNPYIDYNFPAPPFTLDLFDFDGDGIDELLTSDYSVPYGTMESNRITIHKYNLSEDRFTEIFSSKFPTFFFNEDLHATSIQIFDFNNDGDEDISVAREGNNARSFEVWINNGDLTFDPVFSKRFDAKDFNFQEFEVMDVNKDGNLDIVLRPTMNGGEPTELFMYSSYDKGIRLNDCIWINDGTGKFNPYDNKELTSTVYTKTLFPFMENEILHFVGFEFEDWKYNSQNNTLEVDVIDLEVEIK